MQSPYRDSPLVVPHREECTCSHACFACRTRVAEFAREDETPDLGAFAQPDFLLRPIFEFEDFLFALAFFVLLLYVFQSLHFFL